MSVRVRQPAVAGAFYPENKSRLTDFIQRTFDECRSDSGPRPTTAVVVPHAGYSYSGRTAAKAFSDIDIRGLESIIIMGPSHYVGFKGVSVAPYDIYRTPLGDVEVAVAHCRDLLKQDSLFVQREDAHEREHALEVELPFIQLIAPAIRIIPLVFGDLSIPETHRIAKILANWWNEKTLIVVSSDFTHYGVSFGYCPFPISEAPQRLFELDNGAIGHILNHDASGFADYVERTGATICGRIPITVTLAMMNELPVQQQSHLIEYTNSGQIAGNYSTCVGYAAISFQCDRTAFRTKPVILSDCDRSILLQAALAAISDQIENRTATLPVNVRGHLKQPGAAFVSLHIGGVLRGCIGTIEAKQPLIDNVIANARNAAFDDPRFPPLTEEEFKAVELEISCLTQPRQIGSIREISIGKHGVILGRGSNRAVFLPQVAVEQGWDVEDMLNHLARKAGLDQDEWRSPDAKLSIFETIKFETTYADAMK